MLHVPEAIAIIALFFAGAAVFSFLDVVAWRFPRGFDFVRGRSECTSCGAVLSPRDLVPVISYFALRGKCRACGARIPLRCLVCELLGGAAMVLCVLAFLPYLERGLTAFAFMGTLYLVAAADLDSMEIPDQFVLAILAPATISFFTFPEVGLVSRAIGIFAVSVPLYVMALFIEGAFGGGDIKLMAACGAFLGWQLNLFALAFAVFTGGLYGASLLATGRAKRGEHFAFGPFLCAGAAAALFIGLPVINWYMGLL